MDSIEEFVLENQLDAFTRVLSLFPENSMTYDDVFDVLAKAETNAQFVCGFIDLNQYLSEKITILKKALEQKLVIEDGHGHLKLTMAGKERAKKELPQPIEQSIQDRQKER